MRLIDTPTLLLIIFAAIYFGFVALSGNSPIDLIPEGMRSAAFAALMFSGVWQLIRQKKI
jgi:hypothetical protein